MDCERRAGDGGSSTAAQRAAAARDRLLGLVSKLANPFFRSFRRRWTSPRIPFRVWVDSFLTSFLLSAFLVYAVSAWLGLGEPSADSYALAVLPSVAICTTLTRLWVADSDWWEALCRPFERAARVHKERLEAEEELRNAAREDQAREIARLERLRALVGAEEAKHNKASARAAPPQSQGDDR